MLRTHTCGELIKNDTGKTVSLAGWMNARRDHGGLIFIDIRDRYGITQCTFDPGKNDAAWKMAETARDEYVLQITGKVVARPNEMVNKNLTTGEIELAAESITIFTKSKTPPFDIHKGDETNENLRLKYRFLDLRRPELQQMLKTRDEMITHIRQYMHKNDFIEVQTPILANSSPEGARDWLVPSRLYPGKFYALPQAPQQFKQLLMVAGIDRYFQIAPCFRDEDPRMDRHYGEFYQLDMEMSFVEQEDIFAVMEPLMIELTETFSKKTVVKKPFPRISYKTALERYGSDKPDLRFDSPITPITEIVKHSGFGVFDKAIETNGVVHALKVENVRFSRADIDALTELAKSKGASGLAYIKITNYALRITNEEKGDIGSLKMLNFNGKKVTASSPILKFLSDQTTARILETVDIQTDGIIFFGAGEWEVVCKSLGAVRDECGARLGLKDKTKAAWCWITDFPMYQHSELEPGKIDFAHNPFSMPQGGLETLKTKPPLEILAHQYDLVCNGFEITSGAIRNHDPEIMYKAFEIAGYSREEVNTKFGHMIRAFEYGAPPHGGNAPGIDRLLMVLLDTASIRDIYAFPKDGQGRDVMLDAPGEVEEKQLKELHIKITG